jgi:beta-lysine 5,6-aminomutase beta subunit
MNIKPYGDRLDDGYVQMSFTLPVKSSPEAREAAVQIVKKMGFNKVAVATMESIDEDFTFFVVYGQYPEAIDFSQISVVKLDFETMSFDEINDFIRTKIKRKLVVLGACIGSDAHTVGIDAIFNMKGFAHDFGLERYEWLSAHNLRAQVATEDLVKKCVEMQADAVLISRVITQRDEHIIELKKFLEVLKVAEGVNPKLIKICGGPRITHEEAISWGYDAGFGPGTKPSHVASFIVQEFLKKI